MNNCIKKATLLLLVAGICVGMLADPFLPGGCDPFIAQAKTTDYSRYSNMKKSWFIRRGMDYKPSEGAVTAKNLETYQAYYYDAKTKEKVLYLTFDCGYENGYTGKLLDVLKKHDVKAVFFVTKHFVKSQPKLCKRMKEEGHLVGNHTMNHPSLPTKSVSQIKNEIKGVEQIFKEETGYALDKYFRPPMGEFSDRVLKVAQNMGYTTVFWSMAYYDYDPANQPGKQYVIDHFKKYYHKGAIALMHNISKSNTEALDEVLAFLKKQGYRCMRIDALGKSANVKVAEPQWDEYLFCDGRFSPDYIELRFFTDSQIGQKPDGFEIYRKEKGGTYQLLATKKAPKDSGCRYVDRSVKPGKTYYYKVKSYCYLYGNKYVSKITESMKKTTVNQNGKYAVEWMETDPGNAKELIVKITSDKNNAVSKFTPEVYADIMVLSDGANEAELDLCAYSTDAVVWHDLTKKPGTIAVLKPSQTIYLRFQIDGQCLAYDSENGEKNYSIHHLSLKYNGFYYSAKLNLNKKTGSARIVGEFYH